LYRGVPFIQEYILPRMLQRRIDLHAGQIANVRL
jgi:hypothetical protein